MSPDGNTAKRKGRQTGPTPALGHDRAEAEAVDESRKLPAKAFAHMTVAERIAFYGPELLRRHSAGETITRICDFAILEPVEPGGRRLLVPREPGAWPDRTSIYGWIHADPEFAQRFSHARALWREALRDEMLDIADDGRADFIPSKDGYILDTEHLQRSKLRIYAREQLLDRAKWQGTLGDEAADAATKVGAKPVAPPAIHVVGIEPRQATAGPSVVIDGEAVHVEAPDEDELEPL